MVFRIMPTAATNSVFVRNSKFWTNFQGKHRAMLPYADWIYSRTQFWCKSLYASFLLWLIFHFNMVYSKTIRWFYWFHRERSTLCRVKWWIILNRGSYRGSKVVCLRSVITVCLRAVSLCTSFSMIGLLEWALDLLYTVNSRAVFILFWAFNKLFSKI